MAIHISQPLYVASPGATPASYSAPPTPRTPLPQLAYATPAEDTPAAEGKAPEGNAPAATSEEDDGFTFWDFLDIINPLQHIPVVSTLYRSLTGDEIAAPAKIAGSALFGGPIGLVAGLVDYAIEEETGKDVGEHVMSAFLGDEATPDKEIPSVAEAPAQETPPEEAPPPEVAQAPTEEAQGEETPAPTLAPAMGPAKGPLFDTRKGFSPYAPVSAPPVPTTTAAARPPAGDGKSFRAVPMFRPDPDSVVRALEAQGFNTQTSHPMLNLGPSGKSGPGVGMNLASRGVPPPYRPSPIPAGLQVGGAGLIDPALKAKMAQHDLTRPAASEPIASPAPAASSIEPR